MSPTLTSNALLVYLLDAFLILQLEDKHNLLCRLYCIYGCAVNCSVKSFFFRWHNHISLRIRDINTTACTDPHVRIFNSCTLKDISKVLLFFFVLENMPYLQYSLSAVSTIKNTNAIRDQIPDNLTCLLFLCVDWGFWGYTLTVACQGLASFITVSLVLVCGLKHKGSLIFFYTQWSNSSSSFYLFHPIPTLIDIFKHFDFLLLHQRK